MPTDTAEREQRGVVVRGSRQMRGAVGGERAVRTPDSLSIPITVASTPSGVWMMSLTRTSKCFRSASAVHISFFLPLPFLPPFFGMVRSSVCPTTRAQNSTRTESRYTFVSLAAW